MEYYYNPEVKYLLLNHSNEKVKVTYANNSSPFLLPLITSRPPFYTDPIYEPTNPIL